MLAHTGRVVCPPPTNYFASMHFFFKVSLSSPACRHFAARGCTCPYTWPRTFFHLSSRVLLPGKSSLLAVFQHVRKVAAYTACTSSLIEAATPLWTDPRGRRLPGSCIGPMDIQPLVVIFRLKTASRISPHNHQRSNYMSTLRQTEINYAQVL